MKQEWSIKIQQARQAMGLTQKELAEAIGIAERTIIKFENSTGFPSYYTLIQLCNYLNLNPYDIIELCSHPEYYKKEFNEITRIISKSNKFEVYLWDISAESSKYSGNSCTIYRHPKPNDIPDAEYIIEKEALLLKSYEIKQQLKQEYEQRLLKYVESLFNQKQKPD